ncbi:MAG TPA: hypothetical protein VK054_06550 [Beutenbergiaceae bacterium]|nr:hypothetical protein [Beutenbergiaceae bacterium]
MLIWIAGGNGGGFVSNGRARYIHAMVDVTPGDVFILQPGGGAQGSGAGRGKAGTSSFAQGGRGGVSGSFYGGGGGGASAIVTPNGKPLIVAGGGGGANVHNVYAKGVPDIPARYWGTSFSAPVPQNPNLLANASHSGKVGEISFAGGYGWHKGDNGLYRVVATGGAGGTQTAGGVGGKVRVINPGAEIHARVPGNAAKGSRGANGPNAALGNASEKGVPGGGGGGYYGGGSGAAVRLTSDPYKTVLIFGRYTTYKITGTGGGGSSWARQDVMVMEQSLYTQNDDPDLARCGYVAVSFMC